MTYSLQICTFLHFTLCYSYYDSIMKDKRTGDNPKPKPKTLQVSTPGSLAGPCGIIEMTVKAAVLGIFVDVLL